MKLNEFINTLVIEGVDERALIAYKQQFQHKRPYAPPVRTEEEWKQDWQEWVKAHFTKEN